MINNSSFKAFLELLPWLRELITDFYSSNYASCLQVLEKMKVCSLDGPCWCALFPDSGMIDLLPQPELELDLYLSDHVEHLCKEIRSHAIAQFFYPYLSVDLHQMAQTFSTDTAALEKEACELIDAGRLAARIDSYQKVQQRSAAIIHQ